MKALEVLKSKFLKDMATLQVGSMLTSIGNLFSTILLAFILGPREQGNYFASIALFSLVSLILSSGIGPATVSQVSSASARGNSDKAAAWLAFQLKAGFFISGGICLVGYWLFPFIAGLDFMGGNERIGILAWWITAAPIFDLPRGATISAFQATRKMLPLAQTENAHEVMRVFLVTCGAVVTGKAEGAIVGMILASLLSSALSLEMYRLARVGRKEDLPSIASILSRIRAVPLMEGFPLSLRIGLLRCTDALGVQIMPILVINAVVGSEVVAYTKTAQRIMSVPVTLTGGISRTLFPVMYQFAGLKDVTRFKQAFLKATLFGGSMTTIVILCLLPFIHTIVGMFWPPRYVEPVSQLAQILAIGNALLSFGLGIDAFHVVTGTMKGAVRINLAAMPTTPLMTIALCSALPMTGGAWGITITMSWVLFQFVYLTWVYRRFTTLEPSADSVATPVQGAS